MNRTRLRTTRCLYFILAVLTLGVPNCFGQTRPNVLLSPRSDKSFGFARVFGDHMVLQAEQPIRVWGRALAGAKVAVALSGRISGNVGMAITIDTGNPKNVHPGDKEPVGSRLANWAWVKTYGKVGVAMGPLFRSKEVRRGSLVVSFDHAGGGLSTSDGKAPNHFEIAGADGAYHPAEVKTSSRQSDTSHGESRRSGRPRSIRQTTRTRSRQQARSPCRVQRVEAGGAGLPRIDFIRGWQCRSCVERS